MSIFVLIASLCKGPGRNETEHWLCCVCLLWFWYFPRKIPNSGIRAGSGSLRKLKKLKGEGCCCSKTSQADRRLSSSVKPQPKGLRYFSKLSFVLLLKEQSVI